MSSTERAPEPTMEEILASIRRIITDDETGQARAPKPAQQAQQDDENLEGEGEADNQIIDDIARVLSAGAPAAPAAPFDEEEEILDLTAELGGLELVEDDAVFEADVEFEAAPFEPEFVMEAPASIPPAPPAQDMAPPKMAPPQMEMQAPQPPQPQAPAQAPEPQPSASQEAASALERAIAALRAGQVPTSTTPQAEPFQFQAAPQPESMPAPVTMPAPETMAMPEPMPELQSEPVAMAIPMAPPEPQAETHADEPEPYIEAAPEPSFEAQPDTAPTLEQMGEAEAELELTEFEMTVVTETEEVVEFEAEPEVEAETMPFWPSEAPTWEAGEPEYEPEPVAAQVNGAGTHGIEDASKTLEDSVKDMLRPMLRQWLDENMPRMVTAALKDELGTDSMDGRRD